MFKSLVIFLSTLGFLSTAVATGPSPISNAEGNALARAHIGSYTVLAPDAIFGATKYQEFQFIIRQDEVEYISGKDRRQKFSLDSEQYKLVSLKELNEFLAKLPEDKGRIIKNLAGAVNQMVSSGKMPGDVIIQIDMNKSSSFGVLLFSKDAKEPAGTMLIAMEGIGIVPMTILFGSSTEQMGLLNAAIEKMKADGKVVERLEIDR